LLFSCVHYIKNAGKTQEIPELAAIIKRVLIRIVCGIGEKQSENLKVYTE
jgi:D-arabinose 5-phosphate isomerase GutQ